MREKRLEQPPYDTPRFWATRRKMELKKFRWKRFILLRRRWLAESGNNRKALRSTYKSGWVWPVAIAVAVFIVSALEAQVPFLPPFPSDRDSAYMTLAMGISGVGGLLIGLYYSALITAAGTVYASVPTPLRMRLVRERTGATYMWLVAAVTVTALSASLFHILFDIQSRIIVFVLVAGGSLSVFAFVALGKQAFTLFNPSNLVKPAYEHLVSIIKEQVDQPHLYADGAFQRNARHRAYAEIDVIETVRDLSLASHEVKSNDVVNVVINASRVLRQYHQLKPSIAVDSQWYERKHQHESWHRRSNLTSDIFIHTGVPLQPKVIIDYHWFEQRLLDLPRKCLQGDPAAVDVKLAATAVTSLAAMISSVTKAHDVAYAIEVVDKVVDDVCRILAAQVQCETFSDDHRNRLQLLSATERLIVQLLLDSSEVITSYDEAKLERHATAIENGQALTSLWELPLDTARRLDSLFSSVELERRVEGRCISANWYICDRVRLELMRSVKDSFDTLFAKLFSFYEKLYDDASDPWAKAIIVSGQTEFHFKADSHFGQMKGALKSLDHNKAIEDLMWPKFEFDASMEDIKTAKRQHTSRLAELAVVLALESRPDDLPDFGGQFLALLQEDIFEAILHRNRSSLQEALPGYVAAVLFAVRTGYDSDLPFTDPRVPNIALHAFAELMDLVEIFGLAKIVSEFHGDDALWQVFDSQWQSLVSSTDTNFLPRIASLNALANGGMQMEAHYELRFRWRRKVEVLLEDAPVECRMPTVRGRALPMEETVPTHVSPLIRALTPTERLELNSVNGITVMMVQVIRNQLPAVDGRLSYNERNLTDRLERVGE